MHLKKIIYTLLIFTLALQLLPTDRSGRFFMLDTPEEEYNDIAGKANQLRQIIEEEHKEMHILHTSVTLPFTSISNTLFHYSDTLPEPHPGAIPTPPPNSFA